MVLDAAAPEVTVAIPTYKGAAYLGAAIESVLAQSHHDFELLVLDDNSPDNTREIVAQYHDPRIRYLRNERNLGPEGNWNRCLSEARGRFFKLLPHDDLLLPDCLARQAQVLRDDTAEGIALVAGARQVLRPDGRLLMKRGFPGATGGRLAASHVVDLCVRRGTNLLGEPGAVMFRHALARQVGLFDARYPYVIDLDYWFRLLSLGDAYYVPQALAAFRINRGSWSVAIGRAQSREYRGFIADYARRTGRRIRAVDRWACHASSVANNLARLAIYRFCA